MGKIIIVTNWFRFYEISLIEIELLINDPTFIGCHALPNYLVNLLDVLVVTNKLRNKNQNIFKYV